MAALRPKQTVKLDEASLVARAVRKDQTAIRAIIKQNNRRLFRLARSVLRDDGDAEDAVQEAYLRAFPALADFRGESSLTTWLSRIVLNESLQKLRTKRRSVPSAAVPEPVANAQIIPFPLPANHPLDPERIMAQRELFKVVEYAIDQLPDDFRLVLVARAVEGLSIEETAELLGLRPETVKTRLFRARALLRSSLTEHVTTLFSEAFPFDGRRCERMAGAVIDRLAANSST
jgi:RNA polymerase sigma-70 factor, ECF subfamily